jgi:hypothetical protein
VCGPAARAVWRPNNSSAVAPFAAAGCFTEEHDGSAPLHRYTDHRTASHASQAIRLLGARPDRRPPNAAAFAAADAAADAARTRAAGGAGSTNDTAVDVAAGRAAASAFAAAYSPWKDPAELQLPPPWFLAVGFVRPHLPMVCPKRFWDITSDPYSEAGFSVPPAALGDGASFAAQQLVQSTDSGFGEFRDYLPWSLRSIGAFAAGRPGHEAMPATYADTGVNRNVADLRSDTRRAYRACVAFVDFEFGRVMAALSDSGQAEKTVVAVFSDHGWKLGEFNLWGKHTLLHADVHVPLMVRHPRMQAPGATSHALVELVDLFPTLVDLAMGPYGENSKQPSPRSSSSSSERSSSVGRPALPKNIDGMSLAGLVAGNPTTHTESELLPPGAKAVAVSQYMPFYNKKRCMAYTVIGKVRLFLFRA